MKNTDTTPVVLKPLLGIAPKIYLPCIWLLLMLTALFFLLIYPGLRRHGTKVSFTSSPTGAAVYVDDVYLGVTPVTQFVPSGSHKILITKRAFFPFEEAHSIRGRIFFGIIPPRLSLHTDLKLQDARALRSLALQEIALSSGIVASSIYRSPPIIEEAVSDLLFAGALKDAHSLLQSSIAYLETAEEVQEYLAALQHYLEYSGETREAFFTEVFTVYRFLPHELSQALQEDAWLSTLLEREREDFLNEQRRIEEDFSFAKVRAASGSSRSFNGIPFRFIKGGSYVSPTNGVVYVDDFYMMDDLVDLALLLRFLDQSAIPEFPEDANDTNYAHVSWHLADTFSKNISLPPQFTARLPTAIEWEYAALLNETPPFLARDTSTEEIALARPVGSIGIANLGGSLWEWTNTWFLSQADMRKEEIETGYLREVRGGSWISDAASPTLRGAQDPEWMTPFLGFRLVVIAE